MENTFELEEYDVFDFNVDEVAESVQKIEKTLHDMILKLKVFN